MTKVPIAPVLLLIFNRPETTRKVFDAIRKAKPEKLYVVADGPRADQTEDAGKCEAARRIVTAIDWDCEVHFNFRNVNLGCGAGINEGINWFFSHEEEGIILEDDCVPSPSFFRFCSEILAKYRYDTRVMAIGGNNFEKPPTRENEYSYTFTSYTYVWGWASWRRAWKLNDFNMQLYPEIEKKKYLTGHFNSTYERHLFDYIFEKMYTGGESVNRKRIWDYQWQFSCKINSGLVIVPNQNLVVNIGFGAGATNTTHGSAAAYSLKLEKMNFPLTHPDFVMVNAEREYRTFKLMNTSWLSRLKSNLKLLIPSIVLEKYLKPMRDLVIAGKKTVERPKEKVKAYG
jgi:hypothetical protein